MILKELTIPKGKLILTGEHDVYEIRLLLNPFVVNCVTLISGVDELVGAYNSKVIELEEVLAKFYKSYKELVEDKENLIVR